jgi:2-dehydro-3-deoxyphosphooctonate aldolase (KDO 8-P synthase)
MDIKLKDVTVVNIGGIKCGEIPLFLIAGPCVIEADGIMKQTAEALKQLSEKLGIPVIYKSSFQKDNRSASDFYRGPGLEEGLRILDDIRNEYGLPVLSDVHHIEQVKAAGEVLDVIQIPAYLCMQTDLTEAVAGTGKVVNVKHGQFLAPENIEKPVRKIEQQGNHRILLTERGYTFGYNDLVVDPRSFHIMRQFGYPVIFDITHSVRRYGIPSADPRGGNREYLPVLGRAGTAAGVDGVFIEVHPNPPEALCDASSQMFLKDLEGFLQPLIEINAIVKGL